MTEVLSQLEDRLNREEFTVEILESRMNFERDIGDSVNNIYSLEFDNDLFYVLNEV